MFNSTAAQVYRAALESFFQLTASATRSGLTVAVHALEQVGRKANRYSNVGKSKVPVPKDCGFSAAEAVAFVEKCDPNVVWDFSKLEIPALDRIAQAKGIKTETVLKDERIASSDADCRNKAAAS